MSKQPPSQALLRLAAIVESSDDAIVSKDLTGRVTSWNRGAERLFGYSEQEMVGQSIRVIVPRDRQAEEDEVLARIRVGEKVEHYETLRQRKDGTLLPVSLTVSPIVDGRGRVIGASKIARDITDRKLAELERTRLLASVQDANRVKDEFLATLSHELRTPLNAILGYLRMVREGAVDDDRQPQALEIIERNALSLKQMVEDILDVSGIVSGKIRLDVQDCDLMGVVREAVETVRPTADAKGVRLEAVAGPEPMVVAGDPVRLQQVVWNLLANAVKFTGRGGTVRVQLERGNDHVNMFVTDTGVGIATEFLPHVFERFRQADGGLSRERGGLGLGLAIARHLMELHGGSIRASSDGLGQGATFTLTLPFRPHDD